PDRSFAVRRHFQWVHLSHGLALQDRHCEFEPSHCFVPASHRRRTVLSRPPDSSGRTIALSLHLTCQGRGTRSRETVQCRSEDSLPSGHTSHSGGRERTAGGGWRLGSIPSAAGIEIPKPASSLTRDA